MRESQFFDNVFNDCHGRGRRIVLPESHDDRVVHAANRVANQGIAKPVLLSDGRIGPDVHGGVDVVSTEPDDDLAHAYQDQRGGSYDDAVEALTDPVTHAMTLVATERVHGCVCGANHPSSDTYRAALRIVGTPDDVDKASTTFYMFIHDSLYFFADCALNIDPDADTLASIAEQTIDTAHHHGVNPRVAMLSYSTKGSGPGSSPERVRQATEEVRQRCNANILGEIQFDAALKPSVRKHKMGSAGKPCNVYIFPGLDAANIGYKIAQHLGGASAIGPITQGLQRPVNDLSRGCSTQDIVETVALTAHHA